MKVTNCRLYKSVNLTNWLGLGDMEKGLEFI